MKRGLLISLILVWAPAAAQQNVPFANGIPVAPELKVPPVPKTYETAEGQDIRVVVVARGLANPYSIAYRVRLLDSPAYPNFSEAYAETFDRQKRLAGTFDVWVSSHAGHFGLHDKYEPGDSYDPERFVDPDGYLERIQQYEQIYQDKLKQERQDQ